MSDATGVWRLLLRYLLASGSEVAPASLGGDWRGRTTRELLARQTTVPMSAPVVRCPGRKLGYRFMVAEAAWVLSGDNRLTTIQPYAAQLAKLSDDGRTLSGAYGPPFVDQVPYVTRTLARDQASRQAVVTLWRPRPGIDADTPCTISAQYLLRDGALHCSVYMRSSDAWLGIVYDWFTFSAMSAFVALAMKERPARLGDLTVTAGSQHLYKVDWELATACAARDDELPALAPFDLADFSHPDELTAHLWAVARREGVTYGGWLRELTGGGSDD
jgi:thymidylate synthase-like protein